MVMAWLRLNNSTTNEAHIKKACFCKQAILNPGIDTKTGAGCLPVNRYQLYEPQAYLHLAVNWIAPPHRGIHLTLNNSKSLSEF